MGAGRDHHIAKRNHYKFVQEVIRSGQLKEAESKEGIGCNHDNCPLEAAIVIPLYTNHNVVGTLKFTLRQTRCYKFDKRLARGLAEIFSSQLELGKAETQSKLLRDAEIKSLQAQVNPHFFSMLSIQYQH